MKIAGPRIVDLHEREARVFPRAELFDSLGASLLLPETRDLSAVDLRHVVEGVELRALGLIGYLPLTTGIVLNLRPKFPMHNLWAMLAVADEDYKRVLPALRSYEASDTRAPHQMLARAFCHYVRQILSLGVVRGYYDRPHAGHYKPKVNFGRTLAQYLSRGNEVDVASDTFYFSADVRVNRLVKSACLAFLYRMPRGDAWQADRQLLLQALNALETVASGTMQRDDLGRVSDVPMWLRAAYEGALTVYSVLLGHTKVGFAFEAAGRAMPSFLFCLDDIFESFVRNSLRGAFRSKGVSVLDGNNSKHQQPLFVDNKRYPIKPDMLFRKGKTVVGIGEVKYKPKIDENDRYQVISHVVASGAPVGIWISPAVGLEVGLEYTGSLAAGTKFFHYRLDISGDIDASLNLMIEEIAKVLG